jgi:predicted permease
VRSLEKLRSLDVGFLRDRVAVLHLFPYSGAEGRHMTSRVAYFQELASRLEQLPGIESVSYSRMGPVLSYEFKETASVTGLQTVSVQAVFESVGPAFFHLVGMRLVAGREFNWNDNEDAPAVAITSDSLARRLFPQQNPIGKRLDFGGRKGLTIIGVVNSASLWIPQSQNPMAVYIALMQIPTYNSSYVDIRTKGDPDAILPGARRVVESLGRHSVLKAETLDRRAARFLAADRLVAMLSSFFGGTALLLASIGLFGLMSNAVTRRTSEIGLRMALGAQPVTILILVMTEVVWIVMSGFVVGLPVALIVSHWVASMIVGVDPTDPLSILLACLILLVVAMCAAYLPARRATSVDPLTSLRVS